jgi:uncharacterized protein
MSIARDLYQLQEIDLALEANKQAQTRVSGQLSESQLVLKSRTRLADEQKKLEELNRQQKSTEWEIDDLTTKIKDIEKKLYSGKISSSKELSNLQQEAEDFKKRRSQFEDKALELMDQVELARKNVATADNELAKLEAQWQAQQKQLALDLEQLKANQTTLENKRQEQASIIDAMATSTYQELRKRKGSAVAKVEQGICLGCRIALPSSDLQQARGGGMVRCSSCGRILFLP